MSSSQDVSVTALLKKTEHYDKDERYMATSDLCEVLKRHADSSTNLDISQEREICTAVLRLLHDKSNDVQAVAVKTLGVLLTTVQPEQVLEIADSLADHVLDEDKSELRDVYAIGLRTLLKTVSATTGDKVASRLTVPLLKGIRSEDTQVCLCSLDSLTDLLQRFGATSVQVTRQHEPCLQFCLSLLQPSHPVVVRKRAGNTLACLATVLSDELLQTLLQSILQNTNEVRTLCTLTGSVGNRLVAADINSIVPLFGEYTKLEDACNGDEDDEHDDDSGKIDMREACFLGYESLITQCSGLVDTHLQPTILPAALSYMSYDPNYAYGDDDDEEMDDADDEDMDDEEDEYEDEDDEDDDDDDESWKVRRSAIRVIRAVIEAKHHEPGMLWTTEYSIRNGKTTTIAAALLSRFKEREENCRVELMECFTQLLNLAMKSAAAGLLQLTSSDRDDSAVALNLDSAYAPNLVKACLKILDVKKGQDRSKSAALVLLGALSKTPSGLGSKDVVDSVVPRINKLLTDDHTNKTLRLDALQMVHAMLAEEQAQHVQGAVLVLLPALCAAAKEQWYKVIAEALRTMTYIPGIFATAEKGAQQEVTEQLVTAVEPMMATHDVDQEIKECALLACAAILSSLLVSKEQNKSLLTLVLKRLQNETTRVPAMKAIGSIASETDIGEIYDESVSIMGSFLLYASRPLKQTALETLHTVVTLHGSKLPAALLEKDVVPQIAPSILPTDLRITHLSLQLVSDIMKCCPSAGGAVRETLLDPALKLSSSPHMKDLALASLLDFFKEILTCNAASVDVLRKQLEAQLTEDTSKVGTYNLAECIAVVLANASTQTTKDILIQDISLFQQVADDKLLRDQLLHLVTTGSLGRRIDLTSFGSDISEGLKSAYLKFFESSHVELTHGAAYALGNASVTSHDVFLKVMIDKIDDSDQKQQYLVLSAVREFIRCGYKTQSERITESIPDLLPPLERHVTSDEEGIRTMVAECLGSLASLQPNIIIPKLIEITKTHSQIASKEGKIDEGDRQSQVNANACCTASTAMKLAIAGRVFCDELADYMTPFIDLLNVEEVTVRTAVLLMIYTAAHHAPQVLLTRLEVVMPHLFTLSTVKLQRRVDLGPFTHTVDDALPIRKAVLSIFATCLDKLPGVVDAAAFMPVLASFLGDVEDIQLHAHKVVTSMTQTHPAMLAASVDAFLEPLEKTMKKKIPESKTGAELERLHDWIKGAIRVMLTLSRLDGALKSRKFSDFVERSKADEKYADKIRAIQEDS